MSQEKIAKITEAEIEYEDHGILTAFVRLNYGSEGGTQRAGNYGLDDPIVLPDDNIERHGTAFGMEFVARLMQVCGVERWSAIKGRTLVAQIEDGLVVGLKPLPTERGRPFAMRDWARSWKEPNWKKPR